MQAQWSTQCVRSLQFTVGRDVPARHEVKPSFPAIPRPEAADHLGLHGRCPCVRSPLSLGLGTKKGRLAFDRYSTGVSSVREVVPEGFMLDASVVPDGNRSAFPLNATLEFRLLNVVEEHI